MSVQPIIGIWRAELVARHAIVTPPERWRIRQRAIKKPDNAIVSPTEAAARVDNARSAIGDHHSLLAEVQTRSIIQK